MMNELLQSQSEAKCICGHALSAHPGETCTDCFLQRGYHASVHAPVLADG